MKDFWICGQSVYESKREALVYHPERFLTHVRQVIPDTVETLQMEIKQLKEELSAANKQIEYFISRFPMNCGEE